MRYQNILLLLASYIFYAWWDWRYLSLIWLCSLTNYGAGIMLDSGICRSSPGYRKLILTTCCLICFGVLGIFKYYDFFAESFAGAFRFFGYRVQAETLHLILPVGISFYTFHTLSYTIDVYRRQLGATRNVLDFFLFVSFFPLAMAGPIERASNLLPQIQSPRRFDYAQAADGMRQILWGLFKKVVVADNMAYWVNTVFDDPGSQHSGALVLGAIFFGLQIYCDFSGYSDMAIGVGKLFGFRFLNNFQYPYFSRDIPEFWRRWHISLNTWFRDYLYIPLGGSRGTRFQIIRNTFVIFLVSGFWHGANWTYILWGAYHAVLFLPYILLKKNRKYRDISPETGGTVTFREVFRMLATFTLVIFGWIIFRSESIDQTIVYFRRMFTASVEWPLFPNRTYLVCLGLMFLMFVVEWLGRQGSHALALLKNQQPAVRWLVYLILAFMVFAFQGPSEDFIYFQF